MHVEKKKFLILFNFFFFILKNTLLSISYPTFQSYTTALNFIGIFKNKMMLSLQLFCLWIKKNKIYIKKV